MSRRVFQRHITRDARVSDSDGVSRLRLHLREDYAAVCCAVQNLCVALHAGGIGTKWSAGGVNFDPRFNEAAGVPEDEYVVGTIWFGEAAGKPPLRPVKRLGLDAVLTRHD